MFYETSLIIKAIKVSTAVIAPILAIGTFAPEVYKDEDRFFYGLSAMALGLGFTVFVYAHFYMMGL